MVKKFKLKQILVVFLLGIFTSSSFISHWKFNQKDYFNKEVVQSVQNSNGLDVGKAD